MRGPSTSLSRGTAVGRILFPSLGAHPRHASRAAQRVGGGRAVCTKGHTNPPHPGLQESHIQDGPAPQGEEGALAPSSHPEAAVEMTG